MSGQFGLDWATFAVSLFNTILLLWLGLTVLLNADRRTAGLWLAGGGLLVGAAFFLSHTAILGLGAAQLGPGIDFWWRAGWLPVVLAPLAWSVVMAWYGGYLLAPEAVRRAIPKAAYRRQRLGLAAVGALAAGLAGLLVFANPLPSFLQVATLDLQASPAIGGVPIVILAYPPYIVLCIGLALAALRRPAPAQRLMGGEARRRALPWLAAATAVLLLVSLLVGWAMIWIVTTARGQVILPGLGTELALFDLAIAGLIAVATLLVGQAVVAYEIFTGKSLPRRALARAWRRAVLLAGGAGTVFGLTQALHAPAIYAVLFACLLLTVFYALLNWRLYSERERLIAGLRPFLAGPRLYDRLVAAQPAAAPQALETLAVDLGAPFAALCMEVLGARRAVLAPLGPLAALDGRPLVYPPGTAAPPALLAGLRGLGEELRDPGRMVAPLEGEPLAGWELAVPLWSERGLVGVLALGEKRDGGLYAQEEIEAARAAGERLVDLQAGAALARRLMDLQRQRLAQTQVADRRARRTLHDEVLPDLHAALIELRGGEGAEAERLIKEAHRRISDLLRELPSGPVAGPLREGLWAALRRVVDEELDGAFERVDWELDPEAEAQAARLAPLVQETVFYAAREALRNAARHARPAGNEIPLRVQIRLAARPRLALEITDNGVGLNTAGSGAQTTNASRGDRPEAGYAGEAQNESAGQGLALHGTLMAVIGGSLALEGLPEGARVRLELPEEPPGGW